MTNRDFFAQRLKMEIPAFLRVIRAMPEDQLEYKPHEKNTPAGALAWQVALEMAGLAELMEKQQIDFKMTAAPAVEEIAAALERHANVALERIGSVSEEQWNGPGKFLYAGQLAWESSVSDLAWGFLFDLVHHRGQLSAYLRPMGGKVPAIYGPSADEQG
ncbi:MAG TPA: DinB family protein [Thermoanaerobaculia bacterium]|jgi:uncharacterized damage-inducible protein DinB